MTRRERMAQAVYRRLSRTIPELRVEIVEMERLKLYLVEISFGDGVIAASWQDVATFAAIREITEERAVEYYVKQSLAFFNSL